MIGKVVGEKANRMRILRELFTASLVRSFALPLAVFISGSVPVAFLCGEPWAWAGEPSFTAEADPRQIGQDESVSLSLTISSEGNVSADQVEYDAPEFETINEYNSNFVRSFYDGNTGRFGMTHTQKLTKVLRPLKTGNLAIRRIRARIGGKMYSGPDIIVHVTPPGAGTPPPRNYGGGGVGLRGAGKRTVAREVLLRAEVDKDHAFKGEQVVISYYLYRRARVYNIQVDKFPELKGFLREEMEMPVMGTRLDSEQVILDGVPYERSLLARYAAYPLQDGKLKVDPMGLKYNYFVAGSGLDDDGDPFFQFFRQSQPRQGSSRNEPLSIEVMPLPPDGRPSSFSGGVGSFNVVAAVDKYEVRANEAVTLTVKVEGKGNLAAIGEPKTKWPENLELYDSKGKVNSGKGGVGAKVFEFLLIPRVPGKLTLPPLEFSFFDPSKKAYVTTHTDAIDIQVLDPAPGSQVVSPGSPGESSGKESSVPPAQPNGRGSKADELRYLKPPAAISASGAGLRWIYLACMGLSLALITWLGGDLLSRVPGLRGFLRRRSGRENNLTKTNEKVWQRLRQDLRQGFGEAQSPETPMESILKNYELLSGMVFDALDRAYGVGARSLSRADLKQLLVNERGMTEVLWGRIEKLLEFTELVRFTGSSGVVSPKIAREELGKWVDEAEAVVRMLDRVAGRPDEARPLS